MATSGAVSDGTRVVRGLRWLALGRSERAAWGRCQGSAATPYETVVAADRPTVTACSCPSGNRPCKHAVGLADLATDGQIATVAEPDWVARIVDRRPFTTTGAEAAGARGSGDGPVDPEAAARRAEARREKVAGGLTELQLWLGDQVRTGLAALPRAGYGHFDAIAARMVDAQAPAVAAGLRALPSDLVTADWPTRALHALGGLHLLARAHEQLDDLPDELAATVRSRVGYPVSKDAVRGRPAVLDTWWALAAVDTVEYQLTTRRVWLRGLDSGRWALWLTVAPPGRDLDLSIRPGRTYACAAHFYPGSGQHRALIEPPLPDSDEPPVSDRTTAAVAATRSWGGDDLATVGAQLAELLAADPWATRLPVVVAGVPVPPTSGGSWRLRDAAGRSVALTDGDGEPWPLVAQAGGEPLQVMGEYDGRRLLPLAVLPDARGRRYSTALHG